MKRLFRIFVPFVLVCAFTLLAGCSGSNFPNEGSEATWNLANAEPIYITQWPENEYTAQIVKPQNGEPDYVYDDSDSGRYGVFMKNMSEETSADYIEELKKLGYSQIVSDANQVSVGTILQKGPVCLSVAYSGTVLGLLITMESNI